MIIIIIIIIIIINIFVAPNPLIAHGALQSKSIKLFKKTGEFKNIYIEKLTS